MLTDEQITALREYLSRFLDPVQSYLIQDICERIAAAGKFAGIENKLTATTEYEIYLSQTLGKDFDTIQKEIKRQLKISQQQMDDMFQLAAKTTYDGQVKIFGGDYIPFEKNGGLQQIVRAAVDLADDNFRNVTQTLGMVSPTGAELPLKRFYNQTMDYVFNNVSTGAMDYNTAVRNASKTLAEKGITSIGYESGVTTSLEAAVRRSALGGLGLMVENISQYNHDTLQCDGWEMSAHAMSAPDHEPYQGKQYTDAEWIELNGLPPKPGDPANKPEKPTAFVFTRNGKTIVGGRRVGTLNCGHIAFPIHYGVNEPQYTKERLQEFKNKNAEGFTYKDFKGNEKHYTRYEAGQRMRDIEAKTRRWQDEYKIAVDTLNPDQTMIASSHIVKWRTEYKRFSSAAKLKMHPERFFTVGYAEARKKAAGLGFVVPRAK